MTVELYLHVVVCFCQVAAGAGAEIAETEQQTES
jgi:hypothetical protein